MDIILLCVIIVATGINILVVKRFIKSLSKKIDTMFDGNEQKTTSTYSMPLRTTPASAISSPYTADKPSKNTVLDVDENEVELNENIPMAVPPDVKMEVEGGDSYIPPGYASKSN